MKRFLSSLLMLSVFLKVSAQEPLPRYTPFTAVKWLQDNPYVMVDNEWYLLVMVNNTEAKSIVDFCKKKYGDKWQKRFSEDFSIVIEAMGNPPKSEVKLKLMKDGKTVDRTLTMTADNRKQVVEFNRDHPPAEEAASQQEIVDQTQKDIASTVNIKSGKIYPFKSAKFDFRISGYKLYSGTETIYIDGYGSTVVVISDKPNGLVAQKTTVIWKADQCTTINHISKSYFISPVRQKSTEPPVISYSTPEQRKQGGYMKKPDETLLGRQCEVYENSQTKVTYWLWKGFALKEENYSLGAQMGFTKEPVTVEENIALPESLFQIPDGYKKQ